MDIKLKHNINTFNDFKLLLPKTRLAEDEIFISTLTNSLNFLSPNAYLSSIELFKNKNKYLFYENLNKEFLERNKRIEGPILRGDEKYMFDENKKVNNFVFARLENKEWIKDDSKNQVDISIEAISHANRLFINNISSNYSEPLQIDYQNMSIFNRDNIIKKFRILMHAFGALNTLSANDTRFYYNPIYKKFEPIFNDGSVNFINNPNRINFSKIDPEEKDVIEEIIFDLNNIDIIKFNKILFSKGLKISETKLKRTIKNLIDRLNKIKKNNHKNINQKKPIYKIDELEKFFSGTKLITSYHIKNYIFEFCENSICEQKELKLKDIIKLLDQRFLFKKKNVIFIGSKSIVLNDNQAKTKFQKELKVGNSKLLITNEVKVDINKVNKIINFTFTNLDQKVFFTEGVLDGWKINLFNFFSNENFKTVSFSSSKEINGCLNFYDLKIINSTIKVKNSYCEDAINFVRVEGKLDNIEVHGAYSDAVDFDFSTVEIENLKIENALNDCLDFSFGKYFVNKSYLSNCGDKAISIGETSEVRLNYIDVKNSNISVAIKDSSNVIVDKLINEKVNYCITMYRKKTEFVGSKLKLNNQSCKYGINFIDRGNLFINNVF